MIIPIPFLFYRYGARIRGKSTMIRAMREIENRNQRKREKAERRLKEAQASGNPEAEKFAKSELTRVKSRQTYGVPEEVYGGDRGGGGGEYGGRDVDVEREANAEMSRVEGLMPGDLEKEVGVRISRS
jgi:hypothetical protein